MELHDGYMLKEDSKTGFLSWKSKLLMPKMIETRTVAKKTSRFRGRRDTTIRMWTPWLECGPTMVRPWYPLVWSFTFVRPEAALGSPWTVVLPTVCRYCVSLAFFPIFLDQQGLEVFILLACFGFTRSRSTNTFQTSKTKHNGRNKGINHTGKRINPLKWLSKTHEILYNTKFISPACLNLCLSLSKTKLKTNWQGAMHQGFIAQQPP